MEPEKRDGPEPADEEPERTGGEPGGTVEESDRKRARPTGAEVLKDTFEALRARSRQLHNFQEFYKWSILGGVTGLLGGVGAILFHAILELFDGEIADAVTTLPDERLIALVPAIGGIVVGFIRYHWVPETFGSSSATDAMIGAVHDRGGRIPPRMPFSTMLTSAITLGSGGSAGREGPTIFIGAGLGSLTARLFERLAVDRRLGIEFGRNEIRTLAICGAAAGLGAVFRAPLGAALFASSVLYLYGMEMEPILPAMVSSVTSYLVFSLAVGFEPLFHAPMIWSFNFFDLAVVVFIGVVASLVGWAYVKVFYRVFRLFRRLELSDWAKPALGGLAVGLLVLVVPRVWGMGYETIQDAIDYRITAGALVVVIAAKLLATSLTLGSGGSGGDMAPALFIGAALGGLIGQGASALFPDAAMHPTLYVIAGMGALYAAVGKVPLATAILLCETTRNFTMIVPLIVANTTGFLASGRHTIYESQHADATRERADVLRHVPVGEICQEVVVTAPDTLSVFDLLRLIGETGHHGFPVLDREGRLVGVASWSDAKNLPYEQRRDTLILDIATREVVTLFPHDTSRRALDILDLYGIGRIVIVDAEDPERVVGILTKEDVIRAYAARLKID